MNMNVLLISFLPELRNLGVLYLSENLKKHGHDCPVLFLSNLRALDPTESAFTENVDENEREVSEIVNFVGNLKPELIGLSLMTPHFRRAVNLTGAIQRALPASHILWGGIHPTLSPEECLEHVDVICRGEGEEAIVELADCMERGKEYTSVHNLWLKENGRVIKNDVRPLLQNLSSLPFPKYNYKNHFVLHEESITVLNEELYRTYMHWKGKMHNIMITRGCPFHCTYCCNSALKKLYSKKGKIVRRREIGEAIDELVTAKKMFPFLEMVDIQDDSFLFTDTQWVDEFTAEYRKKVGLPFYARTIPRFVTEDRMKLLKDAGLQHIQMGIQGSERINRNVYNRQVTNQTFLEATKIIHRFNITKHFDIILDNPYADDDDLLDVINLLVQIPKPFFVSCLSLSLFPFTDLYNMAHKDGMVGHCKDGYGEGLTDFEPTLLNVLIASIPIMPNRLTLWFAKNRANPSVRTLFDLYIKGVVSPYSNVLLKLRNSKHFFRIVKPFYFALTGSKLRVKKSLAFLKDGFTTIFGR